MRVQCSEENKFRIYCKHDWVEASICELDISRTLLFPCFPRKIYLASIILEKGGERQPGNDFSRFFQTHTV